MKLTQITLLLALLFTAGLSHPLCGQTASDSLDIDDLYIDYSIPDISAASLLGVGSSGVEQVGGVKKLALAAYNLYDASGRITPSIALDISPAQLFDKLYYREGASENRLLALATNTAFSVATANDEAGAQFAAGFKIVLVDKANPLSFGQDEFFNRAIALLRSAPTLMDDYGLIRNRLYEFLETGSLGLDGPGKAKVLSFFEDTFFARAINVRNGGPRTILAPVDSIPIFIAQLTTTVWGAGNSIPADKQVAFNSLLAFIPQAMNLNYTQLSNELDASFDTLRRNWQFEHWNAGRFEIRGGGVWNSADSTWGNLTTRRFSVAAAYSGRVFEDNHGSQLTLLGQVTRHWVGNLPEDSPTLTWSWEAGARMLVLLTRKREDEQRFRGYIGARMEWSRYEMPNQNDSTLVDGRVTLGIEFRIAKGTWAELAVANQITNVNGARALDRLRFLPLGGLKYTINSQPRFSETQN